MTSVMSSHWSLMNEGVVKVPILGPDGFELFFNKQRKGDTACGNSEQGFKGSRLLISPILTPRSSSSPRLPFGNQRAS